MPLISVAPRLHAWMKKLNKNITHTTQAKIRIARARDTSWWRRLDLAKVENGSIVRKLGGGKKSTLLAHVDILNIFVAQLRLALEGPEIHPLISFDRLAEA